MPLRAAQPALGGARGSALITTTPPTVPRGRTRALGRSRTGGDWSGLGPAWHRRDMSLGAPVEPRLDPGAQRPPRTGRAALIAWCVLVLASCAGVVVATVRSLLLTRDGQDLDQRAMEAVYARRDTVEQVLSLLGYISIGSAALVLTVCVVLALARRRVAEAAAAVVLVAGANLSTQLLKRVVLDRPDFGHLALNSLPSGHTTVVSSLVLAALLVAGTAIRPLISILGSFAITFTGASTLVAGWHRPSDVVAALAVSLGWGALVVLALVVRRPGRFTGAPLVQTLASFVGAAAAGILLVVIGVRPDQGWSGAVDAALVLSVLGIASATTVGVFARLSSVHTV